MKIALDDVKIQVNLNLLYAKLRFKKDRDIAHSCYRASQEIMVIVDEKMSGNKIKKILDEYNVTDFVNTPTMKMLEEITEEEPEEDENDKK